MSSQKKKKDAYIHLRVTKAVKEEISKKAKDQEKTITSYILEGVMTPINKSEDVITDTIDTTILSKMIKPFAEKGIQVNLNEDEIKRVQELWRDIQNA